MIYAQVCATRFFAQVDACILNVEPHTLRRRNHVIVLIGATLQIDADRTRGLISPLAMIMRPSQSTGIVVTWFRGIGPADTHVSVIV